MKGNSHQKLVTPGVSGFQRSLAGQNEEIAYETPYFFESPTNLLFKIKLGVANFSRHNEIFEL